MGSMMDVIYRNWLASSSILLLDTRNLPQYSALIMGHEALLTTVGARVRVLRERQGLSRRQLSERSGVSERFLAQLETGKGNISLKRFADVAEALRVSPAELLAGIATERPCTGV